MRIKREYSRYLKHCLLTCTWLVLVKIFHPSWFPYNTLNHVLEEFSLTSLRIWAWVFFSLSRIISFSSLKKDLEFLKHTRHFCYTSDTLFGSVILSNTSTNSAKAYYYLVDENIEAQRGLEVGSEYEKKGLSSPKQFEYNWEFGFISSPLTVP